MLILEDSYEAKVHGRTAFIITMNVLLLFRQWGWVVAGAAPGLQTRVSGRKRSEVCSIHTHPRH